MAYPISDVPRRIVYSGSAGVGPYAFTFEVLTASDIAVYKNQTLLTLTTDYVVSINTGTGTGTVTLVVAATGSDTVTLVGDRAIQRTSDFVTGGDLFANTLNAELDAQTIYAQQIDEKAERAIRAPVTDPTTINMVLPPQATRASKALGFSSNGNPTQSASTLAAIDAAVTTIQTIAAASPGSSAGISHIAAGTGAVATTVQAKLRETVSVLDFGTDTSAVQSAINALGAGGGFVWVNRGVSYTFTSLTIPQNVTLFDEANNRIVFHDAALEDGSATNLLIRSPVTGATRVHIEPRGNPSGTTSKLDWMFDPYQTDSVNYRIVNVYTKSYDVADVATTQGNNGVAVIGVKGVGRNFGIWPTLHFGFSDNGAGSATPMKMYYFDSSDTVWRTPMKGMWRTGVAVTSGDYMLSANKLYQSGTTGTTGATAPTHSVGTVSDGAVDWAFVRDYAAVSNNIRGCVVFGDRDDLPKFGLSTVRVQYSQDAAFWNGKKLRFLDGSNASAWSIYTKGATDDLYIETEDGTKRLRLDATGQFIQIAGLSIASNAVSAVDLDTTPSIRGVRTLVFGNTGPTSVTQFDDGIAYQEFYVRAGNGQTTLVHGTNLRLIGGVNKTLGVDDALLFQMNGAGTVATQVA